MKMQILKHMLPGPRRGMGTMTKVLLVALPIAAFIAGKMVGARMENNEHN